MVVTKVHFTVKNLEKLHKDKLSCVHLKKFKKHLSLDPSELVDTKASIKANLNKLISKYDSEMEGVILGFRRMKITCALGKILNDNPHIHFDVEAEFFIFKPEIGCTLKGIVKKMNNDCIGCLVHDIFNVTIPIKNNQIDQQDIECGQELTFVVDFVDYTYSLPYIRGKLVGSLENSDCCQSPDIEGTGNYISATKMKKHKKKKLDRNSVSNVSPKENSLEHDEEDLSDLEERNKEKDLSPSGKTPKHPISILKKEGTGNTPKRISFYGDIPLSHETVEKLEDTEQMKKPAKVKKAKAKGNSNLELMEDSQGLGNLKKTKKKKGMVAQLDMLDSLDDKAVAPINEMEDVSENPLTESPIKKTKKKKGKKTDLHTSVFDDSKHSDKVIKEDEEYNSENIDSVTFRSREKKGKKIKKDDMESIEVRDVENSDGVKLKEHTMSTKNPDPLSSTPFAKSTEQNNLVKKKKNKKNVESLALIDDNTNKTKSNKHKRPAELDISQVTESVNLNYQNTPVIVNSKKLRRLSLHNDFINEPVDINEENPDGSKSKKPKSEMLDTLSSSPSKLSDHNNLQKTKKKQRKNAEIVDSIDTFNNETKSKKHKRTSGLLDIPSDIESLKLETRGKDSSIINAGNVKDESSNSPKKKKKGEFHNEAEMNNALQINRNKITSNENDNSECIGQKETNSPKKGIGFSSFRTFANSTVIAPSHSKKKKSRSSSPTHSSFDLPSPIKRAETETDMLDEMDFVTSTQINPEDCLHKEILPKPSKIVKRQKHSTITEPENSTNAKLKITKENASKLPKLKLSSQNAPGSKTPVKTNNESGAGAAVRPKISVCRMSTKLLDEFKKKVESKAQSCNEVESELDSSDSDLPSGIKNLTSLRTKFKLGAESETTPIMSKGSSKNNNDNDNDSEETELEDIIPASQNLSKIEERGSGLSDSDSDKDSSFVSSMKPNVTELDLNFPSKKGRKGSENSGISLASESLESKQGKDKNTSPKLKKKKLREESVSKPIMSKGSPKKRMDNNNEEILSEDFVSPSQNLPKMEGKDRLKKNSKKVQSQEEQPKSLSPETISSLAIELLKKI